MSMSSRILHVTVAAVALCGGSSARAQTSRLPVFVIETMMGTITARVTGVAEDLERLRREDERAERG